MKSSTRSTVVLVCSLLVLLLVSQIQCSNADDKLIEKACKKAGEDYGICVFNLKVDKRNDLKGNLRGLSLISLSIVGVRATTTQNKIRELLKQKAGDDPSLFRCNKLYTNITKIVKRCEEDIAVGSPGSGAMINMNIIISYTDICKTLWGYRQHPFEGLNIAVAKVASVAKAVLSDLI